VDVVLGIVNPDHFLGGRKKLSRERAAEAIRGHIAEPLGMSVENAAAAVYAIQNAQTADVVRKVVVNSSQDPRDFVLYSFGGAGPVRAASYAADLGVEEVLVPLGAAAAVFSAYGLAASDIVLTAEISQPANFPLPPQDIQLVFDGLEKELRDRLAAQRLEFAEVGFLREMDMRYTMQMAEVATPVPDGDLTEEIVAGLGRSFEDRYEQLYGKGSGFADVGLQVITYRLRAIGRLSIRPRLPAPPRGEGKPTARSTRDVFLDIRNRWQPTQIYHYADLGAGHELSGPAVVEAPTTTVAIPDGCHARVDRLGNLVIRYSQS
jgi:N-methylhydantoinase A